MAEFLFEGDMDQIGLGFFTWKCEIGTTDNNMQKAIVCIGHSCFQLNVAAYFYWT